jgi:hypothetical protein
MRDPIRQFIHKSIGLLELAKKGYIVDYDGTDTVKRCLEVMRRIYKKSKNFFADEDILVLKSAADLIYEQRFKLYPLKPQTGMILGENLITRVVRGGDGLQLATLHGIEHEYITGSVAGRFLGQYFQEYHSYYSFSITLSSEDSESTYDSLVNSYVSAVKMNYRGKGNLIEASNDKHRVSHCYSCKERLDNFADMECSLCKWIVCFCGACGCSYNN